MKEPTKCLVVHIPVSISRKLKIYCAKTDKKIRDFVAELIVENISKLK